MAILKLICQDCHKHFEVDDDKISWKVKDNWFSKVDYRVVHCPYCGYGNYIDWIEQFRREEE